MNLRYGAYSPDGNTIAFDRCGNSGIWWRPRYHGSANLDIYTRSLKTGKTTRVTTYDGTDLWPMFSKDGSRIYYVTDQATPKSPNLVSIPANGGRPSPLTAHKGGAVRFPSIARNGESITYEYEGDLYTVSTTGGKPRQLKIFAPTEDKRNAQMRLSMTNGATEFDLTADAKTIIAVIRGEIWSIPADKGGDANRLPNNPAND